MDKIKKYDYAIIGGGPTGLTLALLLKHYNKKIIIIEEENYIGGCHGVKRENNLFAEHGPRIYLDNYYNFMNILKLLDTNFTDIFTPYKFGKLDTGSIIFQNLSLVEIFKLFYKFITLSDSDKNISLYDYLKNNNFSDNAIDKLNKIGILTDGGDSTAYTLHNFLQILNQNFFYNIYQPKKPNDELLFKIWYDKLIEDPNKVDIFLNSKITNMRFNKNKEINNIEINNNININSNNYILAIPPLSQYKLLEKFNKSNVFKEDFKNWVIKTNYYEYIPIVFHWNEKIKLDRIWGLPDSDWGIGHIVMSDYMEFDNKTVISCIITLYNKSSRINKTPNEISNKDNLAEEVFYQLNKIHNNKLPIFDNYIINQNIYNNSLKKWIPIHTAFMTTKFKYLDNFKSNIINNLYNCGTHNGKSKYYFTSLESAVSNAIKLVHELVPESINDIQLETINFEVRKVLFILLIIVIVLMLANHWYY